MAKFPQTCFPFQVHNFNAVGTTGLETERTKRYSFMVLAYVIVSANFSSVASCSFYNLENYKESESKTICKTIGRLPSVGVLILKSEYQSVGFTDGIQINIFLKKI